MAQTPCSRVRSVGSEINYTPGSAVAAGAVVVLGSTPLIATQAIAANELGTLSAEGVFDIPQAAETIHAGDSVYWDDNGSPYGGTASSGCATETATSNYLLGIAEKDSANTDTYVRVRLTSATRTATIAGAVTADSITGSSTSLPIVGAAGSAAVGKPVSVTGGAGATGYAGGAASLVGGAGATSGDGGAVSVTGGTAGVTGAGGALTMAAGAGGTTSGAAGVASLAGGAAASAAGNVAGGAVSVTGGVGKGNLAGGAASLVGGVAGLTGAGGAVAVTGGAGGGTSGTGGAVAIAGGAGSNATASGGALSLDGGAPYSSGTAGAITIGTNNAASITLGKMPRVPVNSAVTVGGNVIANANAVLEGLQIVTGADDTAAVKLPVAVAGMEVEIISTTAGKNLVVFPQVNSAINNLGANTAFNSATDAPHLKFRATSSTQWYCLADVAG